MDQTTLARAQDQAALCRLIANPCRLMILWSLADGELAVNEIAARVGGSLQNVSQHLSLLRKHDLIGSPRARPLLEAKKAIGTVKVGEVIEIWSGEENTKVDLPRWCAKVGHEFLGSAPREGSARLYVRRGKEQD